jgi:hypothetical protein
MLTRLLFQTGPLYSAARVQPPEGAASMRILYMGFNQEVNVRFYKFQGVASTDRPTATARTVDLTVTADMALLIKHQIRIQDAPSLCLEILTSALSKKEDDAIRSASYALTREDLSAFTSRRTALEESKAARRKPRAPFKPSPSSQLKWPQVK